MDCLCLVQQREYRWPANTPDFTQRCVPVYDKQGRSALRPRGCSPTTHPFGEGHRLKESVPKNVPRFNIPDQRRRPVPATTIRPSHLYGCCGTHTSRQDARVGNEGVPIMYREMWPRWYWQKGYSSDGKSLFFRNFERKQDHWT